MQRTKRRIEMNRTLINEITPETEIKISGWVERIRESKNMMFLVIRDISGRIQVTIEKANNEELVESLHGVIANSVVSVYGVAHLSEYVKMGGIEMIPTKVEVLSRAEALPITEEANVEQQLNYRWIGLREDRNILIFKIQTLMEKAMREYLIENRFIEIHTPKITAQSSEGGSEVFKLDYFGQPAYLTQSPQLYKQMAMASGFERVMEIGDYFRAEQSFTARHATEFVGLDIEMSYVESHHDVMDVQEGMIVYMLGKVKEAYGEQIKEVFGVDIVVPTERFPRIKFKDAMEILKNECGYNTGKNDFDTESERMICKYVYEKYGSEFVFITDYPFEARAFYTMKNTDDPTYSRSYDLLWKDVEITSGAQREHRPDVLSAQIAEKGINPEVMKSYIEFFEYGCPPHGGFGLGLARLLAKMLNLPNIKEATFLFRGPNRILP